MRLAIVAVSLVAMLVEAAPASIMLESGLEALNEGTDHLVRRGKSVKIWEGFFQGIPAKIEVPEEYLLHSPNAESSSSLARNNGLGVRLPEARNKQLRYNDRNRVERNVRQRIYTHLQDGGEDTKKTPTMDEIREIRKLIEPSGEWNGMKKLSDAMVKHWRAKYEASKAHPPGNNVRSRLDLAQPGPSTSAPSTQPRPLALDLDLKLAPPGSD